MENENLNFEQQDFNENQQLNVEEQVENEPTVSFDTVNVVPNQSSSKGLKVFFSLIAVIVLLICALSVGFIFGKNSNISNKPTSATNLVNKNENQKENSYTNVYNNTAQSVVSITVYNDAEGVLSYASGVVYTSDGYIVTNDHIYSEVSSPKFMVTMLDGTEYKAKFIAGDTRSDLAVLKIDVNNLKPATFGNSQEIVLGEEVIAIGYPSGASGSAILTGGMISSKGIRVSTSSSYTMNMLQTDTAINPGSSGGALVNMYSQVVGITSAKLVGTAYDSVGYAIPSATVVKVVNSLIEHGYVTDRGRLGITYKEIDSIYSEINGIPCGLLIDSVSTDSELYGKNISKNDIITHINDVEITNSNIALDIIENTLPGKTMSFTVYHPSTKSSEVIYGALISDQGSSSYSNNIIENDSNNDNPFDNNSSDFYSDH